MRVRYLHTTGQYKEAMPTLQDDVAVCRAILFGNLDPTEDEPPAMTMDCRKQCGQALGQETGEQKVDS